MKKGFYRICAALVLLISFAFFKNVEKKASHLGFTLEQVWSSSQKEDIKVTEEVLKDMYRQVNQAMVDKDRAKLEGLLEPNTVLIHMTGYSQPVSEWLDQIESEEMRYDSWKEDAIKDIMIEGDRASLVGQSRVCARIWGSGPHTWPLQIEMHFKKINGEWKIIKQIASLYERT